ncbi:response regulator [Luteolibacter algae]|uniref:Response regulator n=1 Tax=Luteolibacter algae TaxID=454151 RepID=A0ABW5D9Q0_9BACT
MPSTTSPRKRISPAIVWIFGYEDDYLEKLTTMIQLDEWITCACVVNDLEEVRKRLTGNGEAPDVILIDLDLPGTNGLEGIRELKLSHPMTQIVVLTSANNRRSVFHALEAGAAGYLLKNEPPQKIIQSIQEVIEGGGVPLSSSVTPYLLDVLRSYQAKGAEGVLTDHEVEILDLLADGMRRKEVAQKFNVATGTVDYYLRRIYGKLGVSTIPGAVGQGFRRGILK